MTTAAELVHIAKTKYEKSGPIRCILGGIEEARTRQQGCLVLLQSCVGTAFEVTERSGGFYTTEQNSLMQYAEHHARATAKMNTLMFTLACALEAEGEKISY